MSIPKIVILGAGYGGIITAVNLQKQLNYGEAEVILVNKHNYHYVTTHLHEPAAGTAPHESVKIAIDSIIDPKKITFRKAVVESIDRTTKTVKLNDGELQYDYLVIGLGSEPETFGIQGLREHALGIRSLNSVRMIREQIEYMFSKYHVDRKEGDLTFIVGGAGFTGIEFVGELADRIPELCEQFDVPREKVRIISVEAAPNVLPGFDPKLVDYAVDILKGKGVEFLTNTPIKECRANGIVLANGEEILSNTVIWTGGVRGNSIVEKAGFEAVRGRVKVDEYLRAPGHEDVYIIGDCSVIFNEQGRPYPPTAQIATQQGEVCAYNLIATFRNGPLKKFVPDIKGTLASLGKGEAIGVVGKYKFLGRSAAILKKGSDLRYLLKLGGITLVLRKGRIMSVVK